MTCWTSDPPGAAMLLAISTQMIKQVVGLRSTEPISPLVVLRSAWTLLISRAMRNLLEYPITPPILGPRRVPSAELFHNLHSKPDLKVQGGAAHQLSPLVNTRSAVILGKIILLQYRRSRPKVSLGKTFPSELIYFFEKEDLRLPSLTMLG